MRVGVGDWEWEAHTIAVVFLFLELILISIDGLGMEPCFVMWNAFSLVIENQLRGVLIPQCFPKEAVNLIKEKPSLRDLRVPGWMGEEGKDVQGSHIPEFLRIDLVR